MYNEFGIKHYKGKWPCTAKTLYSEKTLIGRLQQYFLIYFETFFCSDSRYLISADIIYTEPHTTVPTIWMDTALWVSCSAYLSGMGIKYLIFPFLLVIVCGRKKSLNWNWQPPWSGRLCLNFTAKIMSSSLVTAGIQNTTWYPSLMNIRIRIWLAMQGVLLSCMILLMSIFLFVKFLRISWWNGSIIRRM